VPESGEWLGDDWRRPLAPITPARCRRSRSGRRRAPSRPAVVPDRDLYVVLEGEAVVLRDGREVDRVGPRQFFGEFAALEWGASFAYSPEAVAADPL